MRNILNIQRLCLSLLLLILALSMTSGNNIGNITADVEKSVLDTPFDKSSSNPFLNPLQRGHEKVSDTRTPIKGSEYSNSATNSWTDSLSTLKRNSEPLLVDENGITPLKTVYKQAGLPITDEIDGVLVKVEGGSIKVTIGFHKSYQLTSELYNEQLITSDGVLHRELNRLNAIVVNVPISSLRSFIAYWKAQPNVRYVEVAQVTQVSAVPNDPDWSLQYGPQIIQADLAWDIQMGDPASILVAVIDTGIDYTHPDLVDQYVSGGYDWYNDDNDPMDDHSHGTHCAGIIGATINNSLGIAGVANVSIMTEKVFDSGGYGSDYDAADAIIHATDMGATVLSNSYGFPTSSTALEDAVAYAYANDVVIVVAAGNDASTFQGYPASYPETISVSATDSSDNPASFTNYGPGIDVAAPGVNIYSTIPVSMGSYGSMSGTSMACPHVAGVVALIRAENPAWTNDYVRQHLRNSADDLGPSGWDDYYGYGRVNAYHAVQPPPEHELITYLDAPTAILPSTSYDLGVMVGNWGQNDETDVTLQLWIDDVMVDSEMYSSLLVGTTENFTYSWTPSIEGTYNITAYAVPVTGETFIDNNQVNQFVLVTTSIIDYTIGDFIQMNDASSETMWANFTYEYDIDPTHVYTSFGDGFSWFSVNKLTRQIEDGNTWVGMYHIAQIETDIGLSDTINWFSTTGTVTGTVWYDWAGMPLEAWNVTVAWDDTFAYYHKTTGIWLYYQEWTGFELNMENTSMITWVPPAHDVDASIEAPGILPPGETTILNASVYNRGTSDETDVTLQLWIDDVMVDSYTYPSLLSGAIETLSYPWTPMTVGTYNITAYVVPVSGETYTSNNMETRMVLVKDPGEVAILQDAYPWDYDWTGILDANGITYDIFDSTNFGSIDLSIYSRVIIPSDQPQAFYDAVNSHLTWLETYVMDGGILDLHAAANGWNSGSWVGVLPGGFTYYQSSQDAVDIVDPPHLILHYPHEITDEELDGWDSSVHGYLGNIGPSHVVLTTTSADPVLIEVTSGLGYYVITTQTLEWAYSQGYSSMLENVLLYDPTPPDHDLLAYLEAPTFAAPGTSVTLNATVTNRGIYDESSVELQLLIDEIVVASDTYTLLEAGNSETISHVWTPLTVGTYNITAYAVPVLGESTLNNNVHTKMTFVTILQNYEMVVDAPYTWYDASTNGYSLGLIGDDVSASVDFPFSFNYYDSSFSTVYVSSNGWLSFDSTDPWQYSNPLFPSFDYPYAVALFWDDLQADDNIYVWTTAEFVVIEYQDYYHLGGDLAGTFEVVFFATGEILFQYQSITYDYGSTVGLNYGPNTDFYNAYTGGLDGITDFALLFTTNSAPTVTVTYPNGGETLSGTVTITWTASDPDSGSLTFNIYCWNWDESMWVEIVVGHSTTSYEWDTTMVPDGDYHKIRVVASDGALTGEDTSDAAFTIDNPSPPLVTVTSPNGGETLSGIISITWAATDQDGDTLTYTVYYWDGSDWVELASGLTTTSYDWDTTTVPNGSSYKIRVTANDGIFTADDESDAAFTIDNTPSTTTPPTTPTTSTTSTTTTTTIPGFEAILTLLIFLSLGLAVILRCRKRSQAL